MLEKRLLIEYINATPTLVIGLHCGSWGTQRVTPSQSSESESAVAQATLAWSLLRAL